MAWVGETLVRNFAVAGAYVTFADVNGKRGHVIEA